MRYMELEQIAMIERTEEGLVITGRPDVVEQMEKNLMRGAVKVSWTPKEAPESTPSTV